MNLIVSDIIVPLDHDVQTVFEIAIKMARVRKENISKIFVFRKSIDARGGNIKVVYAICINLLNKESVKLNKNVSVKEEYQLNIVKGKALLMGRPIIIGFGPAGLFCAYLLSLYGLKPIVIERGKNVSDRKKDVDLFFHENKFNANSNIQFGEGGAGTFSDGKLTTRINDARCRFVMSVFHEFGAPEEIMYEAHPHIGTDCLTQVIANIREKIKELGGEIQFQKKVTDLTIQDCKIKGVVLDDQTKLESETVILAIGHSARDTYEMLRNHNIVMEKKPFSVGFRIEHLREFIDKARYGAYYNHPNLGAADYQISFRENNRGCYSFCMCPGGYVIASNSEEGMVVTNGMSEYKRDALNSNSAIVASVTPEDLGSDLFCGIEFQRELERAAFHHGGGNYGAPVQLAKDFLNNEKSTRFLSVKPTYPCGYEFADFNGIFPDYIKNMLKKGLGHFDKIITGFSTGEAVLTGVETRTSAPLRITRDENFESVGLKGLFPTGEGAGYAGGITSAAVDGLKIAQKIIETYKPKS